MIGARGPRLDVSEKNMWVTGSEGPDRPLAGPSACCGVAGDAHSVRGMAIGARRAGGRKMLEAELIALVNKGSQ